MSRGRRSRLAEPSRTTRPTARRYPGGEQPEPARDEPVRRRTRAGGALHQRGRALLQTAPDDQHRARVPDWARAAFTLEAEAVEIKDFTETSIPGLFQTEAYTRGHRPRLRTDREPGRGRPRRSVPGRAAVTPHQREPAAALGGGGRGSHLAMVGGPEVMREQMGRLVEVAALPTGICSGSGPAQVHLVEPHPVAHSPPSSGSAAAMTTNPAPRTAARIAARSLDPRHNLQFV
jgi:hypothetical protein